MINLSKGGRVNLSKEAPGTQKFRIGLGWDANATDTGTDFDLDVSVFLCKYDAQSNPKLISDQHFVFYNSEVRTMERKDTFIQPGDDFPKRGMPASKCLGVVHSGDNRTGSGDGDDEVIFIDMTKLAADVEVRIRRAVSAHSLWPRAVMRASSAGAAANRQRGSPRRTRRGTSSHTRADGRAGHARGEGPAGGGRRRPPLG